MHGIHPGRHKPRHQQQAFGPQETSCEPILSPHQQVHEKNGPPARAVITPTGTSDGTKKVRATVSAAIKNMPPTSAEAGRSNR